MVTLRTLNMRRVSPVLIGCTITQTRHHFLSPRTVTDFYRTRVRPRHLIFDKSTAFTSPLMTELMQTSGIKIHHSTLKQTQTIGMVERTCQKLKQILKINVTADMARWDRYFNIAVIGPQNYISSINQMYTDRFYPRTRSTQRVRPQIC